MVVYGKSGCIWEKWLYLCNVVVLEQKWLNLGKRGCIRESDFIRADAILFGQSGCISIKVVVFSESGCIRAK